MTRKACGLAAALLLLTPAVPALAHHSFAAEFDSAKPVRLNGQIAEIAWANPHTYFYLDLVNARGETVRWACEAASPGVLSRRGWKKGDLKIGDRIIVDGFLARDGSHTIDARRVKLPDGRVVMGGAPGDGGPASEAPQQATSGSKP